MILTTDWHLTSNAADSYRWKIFDELYRLLKHDPMLFILGDLTDRRDRHPSDLVNGLIRQCRDLIQRLSAEVVVICGNHDRPLHADQPYWSFLNSIEGLSFIEQPTARNDLLLLPWAEDPFTEWRDIDMTPYNAAFCHQTFAGSYIGPDRLAKSMLNVTSLFPPHVKVYSGDVHIPQTLGQLTYVGAPHPVKYGDEYGCRILRLDERYNVVEQTQLHPPRKSIVSIEGAEQLEGMSLKSGDNLRVRLTMSIDQLATWREEQDRINLWAKQHGVHVTSVEPMIQIGHIYNEFAEVGLIDDEEVLIAFAESEGLSEDIVDAGMKFIREGAGV